MALYSNFARVYDSLMESVDRKAWLEYIISLFGDAKIERVADCACGTGALSIPLAKRGYKVTGLDASEEMLRIAAENARAERVNVPFVCQDMRRLALHRPADAVLAVCDGVNYLTLKGAEGFFANAYAALREGGMLLFDISSRYKLSTILCCLVYSCLQSSQYFPSSHLIYNLYIDITKYQILKIFQTFY